MERYYKRYFYLSTRRAYGEIVSKSVMVTSKPVENFGKQGDQIYMQHIFLTKNILLKLGFKEVNNVLTLSCRTAELQYNQELGTITLFRGIKTRKQTILVESKLLFDLYNLLIKLKPFRNEFFERLETLNADFLFEEMETINQ